MKRAIDLNEILDLVACAEDFGHWNNVCMFTLYEWAHPVSDGDIKKYSDSLDDGYEEEDRREVIEILVGWRDENLPSYLQGRK